jgi:restriction endonuclease S subunit
LEYTNIPIYVWILSDKKDRQGYVRLIDTSTLTNRKNKNFLNNSFVEKVVDEYVSQKDSKISKWVYNDEFGFYEVDILKDRKRETINIPLGTDIQDFINREIKPYFDGKITIDYPSAEIGYAVKFGDFFKSKEDQILPLDGITNNVVSVLDEMSELKSRMTKSFNLSKMKSVPQHWKKIQLGSIVNVVSGTEKKSLTANSNGLPFLSVSYLRNQSSTEELFEKRTKNQYITKSNALILVKGANSGEVFIGVDGILSSSFVAIRSANENIITSHFLYYLLKGYEKQLRSMSKGANVKFIDKQSLLNFKCLIPPIHEQQNMTAFLDSIVSKIDEVTKSLRSTDNIFTEYRQTLIENVVQGKVRFF